MTRMLASAATKPGSTTGNTLTYFLGYEPCSIIAEVSKRGISLPPKQCLTAPSASRGVESLLCHAPAVMAHMSKAFIVGMALVPRLRHSYS
jgi:hypothetical protein